MTGLFLGLVSMLQGTALSSTRNGLNEQDGEILAPRATSARVLQAPVLFAQSVLAWLARSLKGHYEARSTHGANR